jgi:peptide-methionine (S)-S-oxide reductase
MKYLCAALILAALGGFWYASAISEPAPDTQSGPATVPPTPPGAQVITLGAGCFWHAEAVFKQVPGVLFVTVGYMGGTTTNPTHDQVSIGKTGHAEVARIVFDPQRTTLDQLLQIFWTAHNPTRSNSAAGRSVIFYDTADQLPIIEKSKTDAAKSFPRPIATQIAAAPKFYPAEEYHQDYYGKTHTQCTIAVSPPSETSAIKK